MSIRTFLKGKFNILSVHSIDIQCLLSMCVRVGWPASHNRRKLNQYVFQTASGVPFIIAYLRVTGMDDREKG